MIFKFTLSFFFLLCSFSSFSQGDYDRQIEIFAKDLSNKIPSKGFKVAVIDFRNSDDITTQLCKQLSDDIAIELAIHATPEKYQVVERQKLNAIVKDIKSSDKKDETKIAYELSKKAIASIFITGTIITFGDNYRVTLKIINTEGDLISATRGLIVKTDALEALHTKAVDGSSNSAKPEFANKRDNDVIKEKKDECATNTGTVKVTNSYKYQYMLDESDNKVTLRIPKFQNPIREEDYHYLTLNRTETKALEIVREGVYDYEVKRYCSGGYKGWCSISPDIASGQVQVTRCSIVLINIQ